MTIKRSTVPLGKAEARLREKITRRVGQTVLYFSSIENALGLAYAVSGKKSPVDGGMEFYTKTNFPQKIKLVDAMAEAELKGAHLKKWRQIKNRLHGVARLRNDMAHLVLVNYHANRTITPRLQPAWFSPQRKNQRVYALRDVENVAAEVDAARLELWEFVQEIRGF